MIKYIIKSITLKKIISLLILGLLLGAFEFVLPFLAQNSIDVIIPSKNLQRFMHFALGVSLIYAFGWLLGALNSFLNSEIILTIPKKIRQRTFEKVLSNYHFNDKKTATEYFQSIESDSMVLIQTFLKSLDIVCRSLIVLAGCYVFIWKYDCILVLLVTGILLFHWAGTRMLAVKSLDINIALREKNVLISGFIFDCLNKIKTINFFNSQFFFSDRYEQLQNQRQALERYLFWQKRIEWVWNNLLSYIFKFLIAFYLGKNLIQGSLTGGQSAFIIILITKIQGNISQLFQIYREILMLFDPMERLSKIFHEEPKPCKEIILESLESIRFDNVSYKIDNRMIISNLSCKISRGEKVLFTGRSGTGKSTVFNLMTGVISPSSGNIYINDKLISEHNISSWHNLMSIAPQENDIFKLNFIENITLGKKYNRNDIIDSIAATKLDKTIMDSEIIQGDKTILSHGEQRRLVIARGIVSRKDVVILDEPDAHIDKDTLTNILSIILKGDKTVIIFSTKTLDFFTSDFKKMKCFEMENI